MNNDTRNGFAEYFSNIFEVLNNVFRQYLELTTFQKWLEWKKSLRRNGPFQRAYSWQIPAGDPDVNEGAHTNRIIKVYREIIQKAMTIMFSSDVQENLEEDFNEALRNASFSLFKQFLDNMDNTMAKLSPNFVRVDDWLTSLIDLSAQVKKYDDTLAVLMNCTPYRWKISIGEYVQSELSQEETDEDGALNRARYLLQKYASQLENVGAQVKDAATGEFPAAPKNNREPVYA